MNSLGCFDYGSANSNDGGQRRNIKTKYWTLNAFLIWIWPFYDCNSEPKYRIWHF